MAVTLCLEHRSFHQSNQVKQTHWQLCKLIRHKNVRSIKQQLLVNTIMKLYIAQQVHIHHLWTFCCFFLLWVPTYLSQVSNLSSFSMYSLPLIHSITSTLNKKLYLHSHHLWFFAKITGFIEAITILKFEGKYVKILCINFTTSLRNVQAVSNVHECTVWSIQIHHSTLQLIMSFSSTSIILTTVLFYSYLKVIKNLWRWSSKEEAFYTCRWKFWCALTGLLNDNCSICTSPCMTLKQTLKALHSVGVRWDELEQHAGPIPQRWVL